MRKRFKSNLRKQARSRRVYNAIKKKLGFGTPELTIDQLANYDIKPMESFTIFTQQDEDDRYERHMKPIREAQQNGIVAKQSHTTQILQASARPVDEPKGL
jgi:hypothetical protein